VALIQLLMPLWLAMFLVITQPDALSRIRIAIAEPAARAPPECASSWLAFVEVTCRGK
jgi:hypothetical protein